MVVIINEISNCPKCKGVLEIKTMSSYHKTEDRDADIQIAAFCKSCNKNWLIQTDDNCQ